jgi:hypothetical protein
VNTSSASDMRAVLHIITRPNDALAADVIRRQREQEGLHVKVIDLTATEPDYRALLREIFRAGSVEVW